MELIRHDSRFGKIIGYKNKVARYGKINKNYLLEINYTFGFVESCIVKIYKSERKPLIKDIVFLAIVFSPIIVISIPFQFLVGFLYAYYEGGRNYIYDAAWVNNVRLFNHTNIILIIILAVCLAAF